MDTKEPVMSPSEVIAIAYDALKDIVNADNNDDPYSGMELQSFAYPAIDKLSRYLPDSHEDAAHIDGRERLVVSPARKQYEGQAHHMAKAADSLVNMLTRLDYGQFDGEEAPRLTRKIHQLIVSLEHGGRRANNSRRGDDAIADDLRNTDLTMRRTPPSRQETYPVTRPDGQVVPERYTTNYDGHDI